MPGEFILNNSVPLPYAATVAPGSMGLLAAMPAVTGVFGMAAYSVSRRMKEVGISSLTQIGMPGLGRACVTADL